MTFNESKNEVDKSDFYWEQIANLILNNENLKKLRTDDFKFKKKRKMLNSKVSTVQISGKNYLLISLEKNKFLRNQYKSKMNLVTATMNKFAVPVLQKKESMNMSNLLRKDSSNLVNMSSTSGANFTNKNLNQSATKSTYRQETRTEIIDGNMTIKESEHETGQDSSKSSPVILYCIIKFIDDLKYKLRFLITRKKRKYLKKASM